MLAHEWNPVLTTKQILFTKQHIVGIHLIPSVRLSGKHFALINYAIRKRFVVCAYEKNSAGKYKKEKYKLS